MSKRNSAKVSVLNELHEAIALYMLERIRNSKPDPDAHVEYDEDGNELPPFFIPLGASELQVMVTFLNNNKITATPDTEALAELADEFRENLKEARERKAGAVLKVNENDAMMSAILQ